MAIDFERTWNMDIVKAVLTHPRIYPHISDDMSPPASEYEPIEHPAVWYVLAWDIRPGGNNLLGVFMLVPQNNICWEVHTAVLPHAWGRLGLEAARLLPDWIWANTPCRRITTNVPESNRLALHFAARAGMRVYGINDASYLKCGRLQDQVCLGLSRPAESPAVEAATDDLSEVLTGLGIEEEV